MVRRSNAITPALKERILMDYKGMTPAEIDNILVKAMTTAAESEAIIETRTKHVEIFEGRIAQYSMDYLQKGENAKYFAKKKEEAQKNLDEVREMLAKARENAAASKVVMADIADEFSRRGGWARYFIVTNVNGHIHNSMRCPTCFPTTVFAWLPDQAGMTAKELVKLAGEAACTVCFPDAPVDVLRQPSKLDAPERKAAREKREQEKAERERIKAEKAITNADGSVVKLSGKWGEKVRTVATAERILVSNLTDKLAIDAGKYGTFNTEFQAEKEADNRILLSALAFKFKERLEAAGEDENDLLMDYLVKAKKKFKRTWK